MGRGRDRTDRKGGWSVTEREKAQVTVRTENRRSPFFALLIHSPQMGVGGGAGGVCAYVCAYVHECVHVCTHRQNMELTEMWPCKHRHFKFIPSMHTHTHTHIHIVSYNLRTTN